MLDTVIDGATVNGKVMGRSVLAGCRPERHRHQHWSGRKRQAFRSANGPRPGGELGEWGCQGGRSGTADAMSQMGLGMGIYEKPVGSRECSTGGQALLKMSGGKVLSDGDSGTVAFNSGAGGQWAADLSRPV